ncbi:hypothetical protein IKF28_01285 [Candidatus Saccharibacteria bacterium]|nr:hypothetical protein [Candidatus Saccharibacteria bacterium]MBR3122058.1 hypothetical protein [Candidatus Saccharibacteria bacterium]
MLGIKNFMTGEKMDVFDAIRGREIVMTINGFLEEREKLEATLLPKAMFFRRAFLLTFFICSLFSSIFMFTLIPLTLGYRNVFIDLTLSLTGSIVMIGIGIGLILEIARFIWKKKLAKVGLYVPVEYD